MKRKRVPGTEDPTHAGCHSGLYCLLRLPSGRLSRSQQQVKRCVPKHIKQQRLVAANRELIERFEQKIAATLARIWGEDTSLAAPLTVVSQPSRDVFLHEWDS